MLHVCGITYDHTINYGSCFQAFALQEAIKSIRLSDDEKCSYSLIPLWTFKDYPKGRIKHAIGLFLLRIYHRSFVPFEKKHFKYANCKTLKRIHLLNTNADAFVCGSDVIWNQDQNKGVSAYYLDFAKKYAFAYAASFGKNNLDEAYLNSIRPYLARLNNISVREVSAKHIVQDKMGIKCSIAVDPVLLLTSEDWNRIVPSKTSNNYIFVYTTHLNKHIQMTVDAIQRVTGLKVINAAWSSSPSVLFKKGIFSILSPEKWLQLLQNAEYIVTNSFHATVFSVLFHKKFYTVVNGNKAEGINVRMNDFLTTIGLEDRIISFMPNPLELSEIDYMEVDKKLEQMRRDSLEFLRENLEVAYQEKKYSDLKQNDKIQKIWNRASG